MDYEFKELEKQWLKRKRKREYDQSRLEKRREYQRKYVAGHREEWNAKRRDYYWKHRDEVLRKHKEYYANNPEADKTRHESQLRWIRANKDKIHDYYVKYYQSHPKQIKASIKIGGVRCKCGFSMKCHSRNSSKRKIKCPACRKSYIPSSLEHITIDRSNFKSVYQLEEEKAQKAQFEALVHNLLIRKELLSA